MEESDLTSNASHISYQQASFNKTKEVKVYEADTSKSDQRQHYEVLREEYPECFFKLEHLDHRRM